MFILSDQIIISFPAVTPVPFLENSLFSVHITNVTGKTIMATKQKEEFVQLLYAWWSTTQQKFIKESSVKISAVR